MTGPQDTGSTGARPAGGSGARAAGWRRLDPLAAWERARRRRISRVIAESATGRVPGTPPADRTGHDPDGHGGAGRDIPDGGGSHKRADPGDPPVAPTEG